MHLNMRAWATGSSPILMGIYAIFMELRNNSASALRARDPPRGTGGARLSSLPD